MLIKKCKGKRRKIYHTEKFFNDFNYYDFKFYKIQEDDYIFKGYIYALDKPNIEKLENIFNKYENTAIFESYYEYAPEIKKHWLFISN